METLEDISDTSSDFSDELPEILVTSGESDESRYVMDLVPSTEYELVAATLDISEVAGTTNDVTLMLDLTEVEEITSDPFRDEKSWSGSGCVGDDTTADDDTDDDTEDTDMGVIDSVELAPADDWTYAGVLWVT